jgi:hypothetical protein
VAAYRYASMWPCPVASSVDSIAVSPRSTDVPAIGVTAFDAVDWVLFPIAFVATTVNVYAVPFVSPVTVVVVALDVVAVSPPGLDVTV